MDIQRQTYDINIENALRHSMDGLFVIDHNRQLVYFSDGCERITGADRSFVVGTACACFRLTDCVDEYGRSLSGVLCPSIKIFNGEIPNYRQRMAIRRDDGKQVWVETTYAPVRGDDGEITGVVGVMRDITESKERENEMLEAAGAARQPEVSCCSAGESDQTNAEDTAGSSDLGKLDSILTSLERREILAALQRSSGQRTLAARGLGISRSRLYRRMDALGIDPHKIG